MFIAIIGTRFSGKSSLEEYLVSDKGFTSVRILEPDNSEYSNSGLESSCDSSSTVAADSPPNISKDAIAMHLSSLSSLSISPSSSTLSPTSICIIPRHPLCFSSASQLLDHVTRNWRDNFVTVDLNTRDLVETFVKRPFFMLLSIDAPLLERFQRSKSSSFISLEDFVRENDHVVYGVGSRVLNTTNKPKSASSLHNLNDLVNLHVVNSFQTISCFHSHLDSLNLLDPNRLRPQWDTYFMTLASLASHRSNCMKRRVGAILVRENRIVATGYNGTPRGLMNCNQGGCAHCNESSPPGEALYECICLHAEENALLEAGRERVGVGAVIYCNTCPCLKCTVKIIQAGVKEVVYNLTYKVDDASARLFKQAGVKLRRYNSNNQLSLPGVDRNQEDGLTLPRSVSFSNG